MTRFAHINIISKNWRELVYFYTETFQCSIIPPIRKQSGYWLDQGTGLKNADLEGAHLLLPGHGENGPTLEIYQYKNIENQKPFLPNKQGYGHIAFEVDNVENKIKALLRNGGKLLGKITKKTLNEIGEITFVYARDPEGNIIELQSWDKTI